MQFKRICKSTVSATLAAAVIATSSLNVTAAPLNAGVLDAVVFPIVISAEGDQRTSYAQDGLIVLAQNRNQAQRERQANANRNRRERQANANRNRRQREANRNRNRRQREANANRNARERHRSRVANRNYNRRHYHGGRYYYYYDDRWHNDAGAVVAAGVIGLAAGALAGAALANTAAQPVYAVPQRYTGEWYRQCGLKYRSFRSSDGTFLGYDGVRKICVLP